MVSRKIVLVGGGGNCLALLDVLSEMSVETVGILDNDRSCVAALSCLEVIGDDNEAQGLFERGIHEAVITIASPIVLRKRLVSHYAAIGFSFPLLVASSATVSMRAEIGRGVSVLPGANIGAGSVIGDHVTVNAGAVITHGVTVGPYTHIAPNVTLLGSVEVGAESLIGAASVILPSVKIGQGCTIGAGSVVLSDIPDGAVVVGNPSRRIR